MQKKVFFFFFILFLIGYSGNAMAFNLSVTVSGGGGSWSDGVYTVKGRSSGDQTLTFSVTPSKGATNYSTCWDYMTAPLDGTKIGYWDTDLDMLCYDTASKVGENISSTETHTFRQAGRYEVWVGVKDSSNNVEKALILVEIPMGGQIYDVTKDCGSYNVSSSGDNGSDFAKCVATKGKGYHTFVFPAGSYTMNSQQNLDEATYSGIEVRPAHGAEGNVEIRTSYRRTAIDQDSGQDDPLFDLRPRENYFHHLKITRNFEGEKSHERDGMAMFRSNGSHGDEKFTIQFCTLKNFNVGLGSSTNQVVAYKNNWLNWSGAYGGSRKAGNCQDVAGGRECYRSLFYHSKNSIFRNNYNTVDSDGSSHYLYSGDNTSGFYFIGNYMDFSSIKKGPGLNYNSNVKHAYHYKNIILSQSRINDYTNTTDGMEYVGNRFKGGTLWIVTDLKGSNGFTFSDNELNLPSIQLSNVSDSLVTIMNNDFGNGAGNPYWEFQPAFGGYGNCDNAKDGVNLNPSCTGADFGGNTVSSQVFDTSNPGDWEYNPPKNCSVSVGEVISKNTMKLYLSASDNDSGMASEPRFPFTSGGLMQFSNDGFKWSEVRPYNKTSIWIDGGGQKVYARFRDRDGNWSPTVSSDGLIGENNSPSPPSGLRVLE